jgi:hypothetical protein
MPPPLLRFDQPGLGPEAYADLQRQYRLRRRRFLRMVALAYKDLLKEPKFAPHVPAKTRKYLTDRSVDTADPSKAWVRLRTPPGKEWIDRLQQSHRDAKKDRLDKKATVWTDDAVARDDGWFQYVEEDVNVVAARLALPVIESTDWFDGLEDEDPLPGQPEFPPPIVAPFPRPDEHSRLKRLLLVLKELGVVHMAGGPAAGSDLPAALKRRVDDLVLDTADAARPPVAIGTEMLSPPDLLARVKQRVGEFLDKLWVEVDKVEGQRRNDFIARWAGVIPGADPVDLLTHVGLDLSEVLLSLGRVCTSTPAVDALVALWSWLASTSSHVVRQALPGISDVLAFRGEPFWVEEVRAWGVNWPDTSRVPPAPARPEWLLDGDDTLYRTLTWQQGPTANAQLPRYFRTESATEVPTGWRWPSRDPHFTYWWIAILKRHCADAVIKLKDTADFHANDLIRFCCLFKLFSDQRDSRVPPYVAPCIRAALVHMKYWFDELPATGHKGGEMTFWSENHQIQFHAAQYLAGQLFPRDIFDRSGRDRDGAPVTGSEHQHRGRERIRRWLDRRLMLGFSEFNSPSYYSEDVPPLLNLVDFADDRDLATKAAMVLDLLIFDMARNTCRGSFGVAAGRAYFEHKAYGWENVIGETLEVLFGSRGDHRAQEKTAIALCTAQRYVVPDALLAIGRDRDLLDRQRPFEFKNRVSLNLEEARQHGIGFETADDAAFWWGCGAYFDPATIELTRTIVGRYDNLQDTEPLSVLFKLELFGGALEALLVDTAEMAAGGALAAGSSLLIMAPFPINLAAGTTYVVAVSMMIEGLVNLIADLAVMIENALQAAESLLTGEDPPKPKIPKSALQNAWEAMLMQFNAGNVLSRANLYTYSIGDVMLSSVQNHRAQQISFQKQPWMASLGCDACVWTNAPMDPAASVGTAGWEVFRHLATCQASRAFGSALTSAGVGLDEIRDEGLRDWGGSICLPKIAQHRNVLIAAYAFPSQRSTFSATYSHAWFPCDFFDEVSPAPEHDGWLPERGGGGTWVFGRKDDGYVALCSARKVRWLRDERFKNDPDPLAADRTIGQGGFTSTELRAEDGSNIWVCAIGNRTQFGSFAAFVARIQESYLNFSGVGGLAPLQCTFDMPDAPGTGEPGFRWELFFYEDRAHLNGAVKPLDDYPRFEGPYVEGRRKGRVAWREGSYRIVHPTTGLWVAHDSIRTEREVSPPLPAATPTNPGVIAQPAVTLRPRPMTPVTGSGARRPSRAGRFRLASEA